MKSATFGSELVLVLNEDDGGLCGVECEWCFFSGGHFEIGWSEECGGWSNECGCACGKEAKSKRAGDHSE